MNATGLRLTEIVCRCAAVATVVFLAPLLVSNAIAEPYAAAGDTQLRHDVEYLADRKLIAVPVTTWPMSWADLSTAMDALSLAPDASPDLYAVVGRIRKKLSVSSVYLSSRTYGQVSAADNRTQLRVFEDSPRGTVELGGVWEYTGNALAVKLEVTLASKTEDDRSFRLDGSYIGYIWNNVALTAGSQDSWWGPGHAGSLILSNNARPVPGLALRRHTARRFESRWLAWMGPWTAHVFAGQLESDRAVSDAFLLGARAVIKPLPSLELGVSRVAQWGGEGRPQSFDNFVDLLFGNDNVDSSQSRAEEPGNQIAGFDARYSRIFFSRPLTFYGQIMGEDEAGGFPSRYMGLLGVSTSHSLESPASTLRVNVEYSDTTCQFHENSRLFNCAYNHPIYGDGYRYRGASIGHSTDNDSRQLALMMTLNTESNQHWSLAVRAGTLNRGGPTDPTNSLTSRPSDFWEMDVINTRPFYGGRLNMGVGYRSRDREDGSSNDPGLGVFARWSGEYD